MIKSNWYIENTYQISFVNSVWSDRYTLLGMWLKNAYQPDMTDVPNERANCWFDREIGVDRRWHYCCRWMKSSSLSFLFNDSNECYWSILYWQYLFDLQRQSHISSFSTYWCNVHTNVLLVHNVVGIRKMLKNWEAKKICPPL